MVQHNDATSRIKQLFGRSAEVREVCRKCYVGSVIVSAAAAAIVGGMIGAIWDEPFKGVAIGAGVGAVIGIYQATQNRCADSWNFRDRIPFVHWVEC